MADKRPKNPFLHSHDDDHDHGRDHHGHDHGHHHHHHDDETIDVLDPAQQSLSDALRVSFTILKVIMVLLVGVYCFTGIFPVEANEVAIRLQFGRIVEGADGEPRVYEPGWHFGWPYPIEQKIAVPVATERTVTLDQSFWFQVSPQDLGKPLDQLTTSSSSLNPERDGSLLTGEANIVHAQFDIKYRITDAVSYVTHVGTLEKADALVRAAAEEGLVAAIARYDTDAVLKKSRPVAFTARDHAQHVLDGMNTGIKITGDPADPDGASGIIIRNPTMPLSVRPAYYEGNNAESERAQQVSDARTERTTTLTAAAGPAHEALFELIHNYELQHDSQQLDRAEALAEVIDHALDELSINGQAIGGEVARIINEAKTDKTAVVEQIKSEVNTFKAYRQAQRANPGILRALLRQQALEAIFAGDVETFFLDGKPYIELNRDPQVQRAREQRRLREAQESGSRTPGR